MERYSDTDRDSGIVGYEILDTSIYVYFAKASSPYIYSYDKAGPLHVEVMKELARSGDGINK